MSVPDEQRKQWYKNQLDAIVEVIDDMIPVVGKVMDLPVVDEIEQKIVDVVIDYVWDFNIDNMKEEYGDIVYVAPWSA